MKLILAVEEYKPDIVYTENGFSDDTYYAKLSDKSTVSKLFSGLHKPRKRDVLFDGVLINEIERELLNVIACC